MSSAPSGWYPRDAQRSSSSSCARQVRQQPRTNTRAWRLGSTHGNRRATRPITSSNSSCHRAQETPAASRALRWATDLLSATRRGATQRRA